MERRKDLEMAIKAINTAATKDYVSELDSGWREDGNHASDATVWKLGAMDSYIQAHVTKLSTSYNLKEDVDIESLQGKSEAELSKSVNYMVDAYTMAIEACRFCLKGWDNFVGPDGNPIEFKFKKTRLSGREYEAVDSDVLVQIPKDIILELYVEINDLSNLSEEEVKNSGKG